MPTAFQEKVYQKLREVPKGKITTYRDLARAIGTKAYRAVGSALRHNPYAPEVPCHRVVASDGNIGGFCGQLKGPFIRKKIALLETEGVHVRNNKILDFKNKLHKFS